MCNLSPDERTVMRKLFFHETLRLDAQPIAPGVVDQLCEQGLIRKFDGCIMLTPLGKRRQILGDQPPEVPPAERRYQLESDNDSHRYLIPADRADEWDAWLEIPSDDPASWDVPEFAVAIDGGAITFTNPMIGGEPVVFPA